MAARFIFDSDAWICCRKLETSDNRITNHILLSPAGYLPIVFAGHVFHNELSDLQKELALAHRSHKVFVAELKNNDPHLRRLRKAGVHKGEAASIAWLLSQPGDSRPVFVTRDANAAKTASKERVAWTDVLGAIVDMVATQVISETLAKEALSLWDDPGQEVCRPRDWRGYADTVPKRLAAGFPYAR